MTDEEKVRVIDFENQLFEGSVEGIEVSRSLSEYESLVDASFSVSPEYLHTQERNELLEESFPELDISATDDVADVLNAIPFEELRDREKAIKAMQGRSLQYIEELYVKMAKGDIPERELEESISFKLKPQETIDNFTLLKEYKAYLYEVRQNLELEAVEGDLETAAKYMITDIYRDKINAMLAELYPSMLSVYKQAQYKDDQSVLEELEGLPSFTRVAQAVDDENKKKFVRLLDYVRNGATYTSEGSLTPLDANLLTMIGEINEENRLESQQPTFNDDEIEQLRQLKMNADEVKDFMDTYLHETGLVDYGWITEVREDKRAFSVSGVEKKVKIPATFNRGIIKGGGGAGVVALVEHEIGGKYPGHVMQSVNAENNERSLRLGKEPLFRGKKYVAGREAGGVLAEMGTLGLHFGEKRLMKGGYAAAMEVFIDGGNRIDAIRAFASTVAEDPTNPTDANYKLAANRTARLLRHGGWNSQPLDYVEAAGFIRVAKGMDEVTLNTMLAEAVFAPRDMMRLYAFDMLPKDSEHLFKANKDPSVIIADLLKRLIESEDKED